jgi:hypothetical protein
MFINEHFEGYLHIESAYYSVYNISRFNIERRPLCRGDVIKERGLDLFNS